MKNLILIFLLSVTLFANLQDKIENFMSREDYLKRENLIKILFKNESEFYRESDGNVDCVKVIERLKESGLFKLFYDNAVTLKVEFKTEKNPLIFMKVINDSLESIGYNYYLTESAQKSTDGFIWRISLRTKHLINPVLFAKELEKRGCEIKDITKKDNYFWSYEIDSKNAEVSALKIDADTSVKLKKPIEPYLLHIDNGAVEIVINSSLADHWYPKVTFFDKSLHVISQVLEDKRETRLKVEIPKDCNYIEISDKYNLENIKHGLSIYIRTFE